MKRSYEKKREWMDQRGLCVWNGEWGPVYARKQYDGEATEAINEQRYQVLKDQLAIYNQVSPSRVHLVISRITSLTLISMRVGSLELVDLAVQRHWVPRHGLRLARNQVHRAPQRLSRQETPSCRGRMGHGYYPDPTHLPAFDQPHCKGNSAGKPVTLPCARLEDA